MAHNTLSAVMGVVAVVIGVLYMARRRKRKLSH